MRPSYLPALTGVLLAIAGCSGSPERAKDGGGVGIAGTGGGGASGGAGVGSGGAVGAGGTSGSTGTAGSAGAGPGGTGGSAGSGGSDDAAVADAEGMLEPIRITEGKVDAGVAYHDLRFIGVRLDQYEGDVVTFRIGPSTGTWRTGTGQVRIVNGAFDVLFPQLVEPGYESKLAHIDADGSGRCEEAEPVYLDNGLEDVDVTFTFAPDDIHVRQATSGMCDSVNAWPIQ